MRLTRTQLLSSSGVLVITTLVETDGQQRPQFCQVGPQLELLQMLGLGCASPSEARNDSGWRQDNRKRRLFGHGGSAIRVTHKQYTPSSKSLSSYPQ